MTFWRIDAAQLSPERKIHKVADRQHCSKHAPVYLELATALPVCYFMS